MQAAPEHFGAKGAHCLAGGRSFKGSKIKDKKKW